MRPAGWLGARPRCAARPLGGPGRVRQVGRGTKRGTSRLIGRERVLRAAGNGFIFILESIKGFFFPVDTIGE